MHAVAATQLSTPAVVAIVIALIGALATFSVGLLNFFTQSWLSTSLPLAQWLVSTRGRGSKDPRSRCEPLRVVAQQAPSRHHARLVDRPSGGCDGDRPSLAQGLTCESAV